MALMELIYQVGPAAYPCAGLPLDTPTLIAALSNSNFECWATRSATGGNVEVRPLAGKPLANELAMSASIANALVRLRQIQTQATAFNAQGNYGTANLANLNDLLSKSKQMAVAIGDVATDLIFVARQLSDQFDATT